MNNKYYILDAQHRVIQTEDLAEWSSFFSHFENRVVKQENIGNLRVSTVFLGLDHDWSTTGSPLVFETMIFVDSGYAEIYCDRCSTWDEALSMHEKAVEHAKLTDTSSKEGGVT